MYPEARREPRVRRYSLSLPASLPLYSLSLYSLSTLSLSLLSLSLYSLSLLSFGLVNPFTERSEAAGGLTRRWPLLPHLDHAGNQGVDVLENSYEV
jgi:hypothetical protein